MLRVMSDVERLGMTNPPLDASEMKALAALHNAVLEMLLPTPPEFKVPPSPSPFWLMTRTSTYDTHTHPYSQQYLRRMEETRVPFSRDTHETIICSAARAGEPDVMHERYEALKEAGFTPTVSGTHFVFALAVCISTFPLAPLRCPSSDNVCVAPAGSFNRCVP